MLRVRSKLAAGAVVAAMTVTGLTSPAPASASVAHAKTIKVHITATSMVRMTQRMHPGLHKFVVRSGKDAAFQLVKARAGYTKAEAAHDANAGLNAGHVAAIKRFERNVTLVGGVSSSAHHPGVLWTRLHRGKYWALDTNPQFLRARKIVTVHVGGARVAGRAPRANTVIRAIHETEWAPRPRTIARQGVLSFRNNSVDNHFIAMAKLLPGKTVADFAAWVDSITSGQNPGPPPIDEAVGVDTGVVSPGHRMSARYSLPAGNYVLACFWPDADMGGLPHAFMGMFRGIRVR
jgi:hypothetical protein